MKDLIIEELIYEEDRKAHIARHDVTIDEVVEVLVGDFVYIEEPGKRWMIIGITGGGKYLTVIVGERPRPNTYGLITAWPASRQERWVYDEQIAQQGGENDEG